MSKFVVQYIHVCCLMVDSAGAAVDCEFGSEAYKNCDGCEDRSCPLSTLSQYIRSESNE